MNQHPEEYVSTRTHLGQSLLLPPRPVLPQKLHLALAPSRRHQLVGGGPASAMPSEPRQQLISECPGSSGRNNCTVPPACASMHANGLLLGQPQACDDLQSLQGKPSCRQLRISVGNSFCLAVDPGLSETALKTLTRFPYLDFLITGGGFPGTRMKLNSQGENKHNIISLKTIQNTYKLQELQSIRSSRESVAGGHVVRGRCVWRGSIDV